MTRHFQVESTRAPVGRPSSFGDRIFRRAVARVEALSVPAQYLLAALLIAVIGIVDTITGFDIQLSILYLIPVSMLAWHRGWKAARIGGLVCMFVWLAADLIAGHVYTHMAVLFWNTSVRGLFFFLFGYVLSQLRFAVDEEQRLARTDSLTGVANSRSFLEAAAAEVARQHRYGEALSIAFLDCDNFKEVNDRHGHAEGDDLLRAIASCIKSSLRSVDTVARLGGDEFAILLPETDVAAAAIVSNKVRDSLRNAIDKHNVTFSIGLVTYLIPPYDVNALVHTADQAMYDAKKTGKNATRHRVIEDESPAAAARDA